MPVSQLLLDIAVEKVAREGIFVLFCLLACGGIRRGSTGLHGPQEHLALFVRKYLDGFAH